MLYICSACDRKTVVNPPTHCPYCDKYLTLSPKSCENCARLEHELQRVRVEYRALRAKGTTGRFDPQSVQPLQGVAIPIQLHAIIEAARAWNRARRAALNAKTGQRATLITVRQLLKANELADKLSQTVDGVFPVAEGG